MSSKKWQVIFCMIALLTFYSCAKNFTYLSAPYQSSNYQRPPSKRAKASKKQLIPKTKPAPKKVPLRAKSPKKVPLRAKLGETETVKTGSYFYITKNTSSVKTWAELAYSVANSIDKKISSLQNNSCNPNIIRRNVYIVPGKNTLFERSYNELLATALVKKEFKISKTPETDLILIFNSYIVPNLNEVIVNTSLYYKKSIIYRDSSIFNVKNGSIDEYKLRVIRYKNNYKTYKLVDK